MTVLILTAVPPGLRGHLTRWLLEVSPGVFIGHISTRVRDMLWQRTIEHTEGGRAIMAYTARNEQRFAFKVSGQDWRPVDFDGITLIGRQKEPKAATSVRDRRRGNEPTPGITTPDFGD